MHSRISASALIVVAGLLGCADEKKNAPLSAEEIGFMRNKGSAITRSIDDRDPKALLRHLPSRVHLQVPGSENQQRLAGEVVAKESVSAHLKPWFSRCNGKTTEGELKLMGELWKEQRSPRAGPAGARKDDAMYYGVATSDDESCSGRIGVLFRKNSRGKFTVIGVELPR